MSEMITKLWRRLPLARRATPSRVLTDLAAAAQPEPVPPGNGRFNNREISDLQFIERVVEEAHNTAHPLLERLRFLAISASVLDQFYSVRIAKLRRAAKKVDAYITPDGMTPIQQLQVVSERARRLMDTQQATWIEMRDLLSTADIRILEPVELDVDAITWLHHFFKSHVAPVLTPMTIDEEHPFPFITSGGICTILEFADRHILIPLPNTLPRFVQLPGEHTRFTRLETLIFRFSADLFPHDSLRSHGVFQILRDNELARQERFDDLRAIVEFGLKMRHKANTTLLKVEDSMSEAAVRFVARHLGLFSDQEITLLEHQHKRLHETDTVFTARLPGLATLSNIINHKVSNTRRDLLFPPHRPRYPQSFLGTDRNCFTAITTKDVLVHWPFESFDTVVDFIEQAASDPQVLAIKQTLYRTSDDSSVVNALINAAQAGKAVTTVIELEARENESSNVELAKRMEAAGVQIIYGIVGLKIHCKATLVVRREGDDTVTYTHFSSGNYHPGNARIYTDLSFFTRDKQLCDEANRVFNYVTTGIPIKTEKLIVAPTGLRSRLYALVDNEIAHAQSGGQAHIVIKVNALTDPHFIERLYLASEAGVEVDLIVRRHCSLRPGVEGMSSRIRVKSIVGRFLEHSRIYVFANGGDIQNDQAIVYFGSPDLMERNLDERVELLIPVEDADIKRRIVDEVINNNLLDTRQSWILGPDDQYRRHTDTTGPCSQTRFIELASEG